VQNVLVIHGVGIYTGAEIMRVRARHLLCGCYYGDVSAVIGIIDHVSIAIALRDWHKIMALRFRRPLGVFLVGMLALLTACGGGNQSHPHIAPSKASPPPGLSVPARLAWDLVHTPIPARNLSDLAQRLGHVSGPIPTIARSAPLNAQKGQEDTFWIRTGDDLTYGQVTAKLVYVTPHVYDYVEDGATFDQKALQTSADLLESSFSVTDRRFFGNEPSPGIDDDVHITLLNAPDITSDASGYFSSLDEYPTSVFPQSNQREMIYLRIGDGGVTPNAEDYNETLSHEFQHMIHWHNRPTDPIWVDSGMSVLSQHLNGFDASGFDGQFLSTPDTQLNDWSTGDALGPHFGAAYLFIDYFAEHYGGYPVLQELMRDSAPVPLNFDDVLAAHDYTQRFDDVFAQWVMANALTDVPQISDQTYLYKTISHESATLQNSVTTLPFVDKGSVHQYAAQYYDVNAPDGADQTLTVAFAGPTTVPLINLSAPPAPAKDLWWSNRGANMDATMTRGFDLTKVTDKSAATLNFALWYDLNSGHDFGYVEVSSDGGKSWYPQPVLGVPTNAGGMGYGNGLTGQSGGTAPAWLSASVDLSAFVGKSILVRFETITDNVLNSAGMAVTNINLPASHFTDAATNDNGWTHSGWLHTDNVLPQQFRVQVAIFDTDGSFVRVDQMKVSDDGTGQLSIPAFGKDVGRVIVAVAALAPTTTIPATYTLNVS